VNVRVPVRHWTRRFAAVVSALVLTAFAVTSSAASSAPATAGELSASVIPAELIYGAGLTVTGRLVNAGQGVGSSPLELQADPYPFHGFTTVAHLTTGPDGSFAFLGIRPNRNTHLRVVLESAPASMSPVLSVIVDPSVSRNARSLGPGRTHLSLRIRHTPLGGSASVSVWWFLAARGAHVFRLAAVTQTRELTAGVTYASVTVDPPSKRFLFRVCLNPTWERAMGAPASHGRCPDHDFSVSRVVG
jgi:hypothetical protein